MSEQQHSRNPYDAASAAESDDIWRKEIHARVDRYRTRRGRRVEGAYSMRFPFPPTDEIGASGIDSDIEPSQTSAALAPQPGQVGLCLSEPLAGASDENLHLAMSDLARQQVADAVQSLEDAEALEVKNTLASAEPPGETLLEDPPENRIVQVEPAARVVVSATRPRTRRKVIAFPRHLMATPDVVYRLADPVIAEQPRILDVPEELESTASTPFLDGLTFDGKTAFAPIARDHVELPFRPVRAAQRFYAIAIDATLVGVASALFAGIAYKLMPGAVLTKPLLAGAAAIPVLLWFVYQFLLLVYGGTTPGMKLAKIRLLTFQGTAPRMRQRRNRVLGLCLATASLAMGLLWAFVDVDALCWHDRMSQTYLTEI